MGLSLTNFSYLRQAFVACVSEVQNLHQVAAWQLRLPCPISPHLVQKQFSSFLFTGSCRYDTLGSSPLNTFKRSLGEMCEISCVLPLVEGPFRLLFLSRTSLSFRLFLDPSHSLYLGYLLLHNWCKCNQVGLFLVHLHSRCLGC